MALCAFSAPVAAAGQSGSLLVSVSPPLKQLTLGPGLLVARTYITITNKGNQDISAAIKLVDLQALNQFGGQSLGDLASPIGHYGLANWMTLPGGNTVAVPSGKTDTVEVDIQNRTDLAPGGHYGAAVISATVAGTGTNSANQVSLKQQVVSLVFATKLGGANFGLDLQSLKPDQGHGLPDSVATTFASTGNAHVVPRGFITVTDPSGKLVSKGSINLESTIILPGASRQYVTILQPLASSKLHGRYKLTAYYRYEGTNEYQQKSVYFNRGAPPVLLALLALAVGGAALAGWYVRDVRRQKRAQRKLQAYERHIAKIRGDR